MVDGTRNAGIFVDWIVDNITGEVVGQQIPYGQIVVPWPPSLSSISNNTGLTITAPNNTVAKGF